MRVILPVLFFLCSFSHFLTAQPEKAAQPAVKAAGLKLHHGFVIVHSRYLRPVKNSYPTGLEFDFAWHKVSQKAWNSCHCYPKMGIAATFWDYDSPDILGYGLTTMFYIEPVFGAYRRVSFSMRAGFGLSYQSRPYDESTNPDNLSYSTHVAFPLQLGGSLHFRLKPAWYLDATVVYNHFSNGGIKEPNKGINWPTGALGVSHYFNEPHFFRRPKENWRAQIRPASRLDLTIFMAVNEPESKLFLLSPGMEIKFSRQFARLSAYTLGAEWMYDNDTRYEISQAGRTENAHKGSLAIGHEFLMGKFIFSQQMGYYLYKPYQVGDQFYQRYGLVFRVRHDLSLGINLKAHRHVADFIDFRVGRSLYWKNRK